MARSLAERQWAAAPSSCLGCRWSNIRQIRPLIPPHQCTTSPVRKSQTTSAVTVGGMGLARGDEAMWQAASQQTDRVMATSRERVWGKGRSDNAASAYTLCATLPSWCYTRLSYPTLVRTRVI